MKYKDKWLKQGFQEGYKECLDDLLRNDYISTEAYNFHIKFNKNQIYMRKYEKK